MAVTWQHFAIAGAAASIEAMRYGTVDVGFGVLASVLVWTCVLLAFVSAIFVVTVITFVRHVLSTGRDLEPIEPIRTSRSTFLSYPASEE